MKSRMKLGIQVLQQQVGGEGPDFCSVASYEPEVSCGPDTGSNCPHRFRCSLSLLFPDELSSHSS